MNETFKKQFLIWFLNQLLAGFKLELTSLGLVCRTNNEKGVETTKLLTTDWKVAFDFLKLDTTQLLDNPNLTEAEMYEILTESAYFNPDFIQFKMIDLRGFLINTKKAIIDFRKKCNSLKIRGYQELYYSTSNYSEIYDLILEEYFDLSAVDYAEYNQVIENIIKPKFNFATAKEIIGKLDPKYAENAAYIGGMYNSFIDSLGYFKDKFIFEHTKDEISDHFIKFYK